MVPSDGGPGPPPDPDRLLDDLWERGERVLDLGQVHLQPAD